MLINKLEKNILEMIKSSLKNHIESWYKIPKDINTNNIKIERIRYIKDYGLKNSSEDGFIVEFSTTYDYYKVVLGRSELGLNVEEFKISNDIQNKNGLSLGKNLISSQFWYEYPLVWGSLDKTFDDEYCYEKGGKYEGYNYTTFGMRYD